MATLSRHKACSNAMSSDPHKRAPGSLAKQPPPNEVPSEGRTDRDLVRAFHERITERDFDGASSLAFELSDPSLRQDLLMHVRAFQQPTSETSGPAEAVMKRVVTGFLAFGFLTMVIITAALTAELFGVQTQWEKAAEFLVDVIKIAFLPVTMLVLGFYFGKGTAPTELLRDVLSRTSPRAKPHEEGD